MIPYDDTIPSYRAGAANARRDLRELDDEALAPIVQVLRNYLASEETNELARAYAAGAMDALAPMLRYVDV